MLAQPAVLQKQIWIAPDDDGQRRLPVEAEEMRRELTAVRRAANSTQAAIQSLNVLAARSNE
jgi:hypothetical protein